MDRRRTHHRLTRLGIQVMLIGAFGILGGSLNGLNLLVVVAAITLACLLIQWRISRTMIDSLGIVRRMPAEAFAGKPMRIRYQISNHHRLMPCWLIRVEDDVQRAISQESAATFLTWRRIKASTHRFQTMTGVGLLMPSQTTSAYLDLTALHRGRYHFGRWRASTNAPFALSTASQETNKEQDYIDVYPRLLRLQRSWQRLLPSRIGNVLATVHRQGPSDDVFFGLREYRYGDSPRHIHWRTTARLGEPAVRQFEQQRRFDLCLMLDVWSTINKSDGFIVDPTAEQAISLAATIVVELTHGSESRVLLVVAGAQLAVIGSGSSLVGRRRMLQALAQVSPSDRVAISEALRQASFKGARLPDLVVISTRSQIDAVAADTAAITALRQWKTRGQVTWVDVSDNDINQWIAAETR